jgi:hypothetical protein
MVTATSTASLQQNQSVLLVLLLLLVWYKQLCHYFVYSKGAGNQFG